MELRRNVRASASKQTPQWHALEMNAPATRVAAMTRRAGALIFCLATWLCAATFAATLRTASAQEPPKNFVFLDKRTPVVEITFNDAEGHARKLAEFRGKVVLVNVWATWCIP